MSVFSENLGGGVDEDEDLGEYDAFVERCTNDEDNEADATLVEYKSQPRRAKGVRGGCKIQPRRANCVGGVATSSLGGRTLWEGLHNPALEADLLHRCR